MKTNNVLTVVAAAAFAVFAQSAFAQPSAPSSRAEVKAETKAAAKSGGLTPAGQGPGAMSSGASGVAPGSSAGMSNSSGMPSKTRMERKDETKAAAKSGGLKPAGEAADMKMDKMEKNSMSDKTRAQRKSETKSAVKSGQTQPAGEAAQPAGEAPKK